MIYRYLAIFSPLDNWIWISASCFQHKFNKSGHFWNFVTITKRVKQVINSYRHQGRKETGSSCLSFFFKERMKEPIDYLIKKYRWCLNTCWEYLSFCMTHIRRCDLFAKICRTTQSRKPSIPEIKQTEKTGCYTVPALGSWWTRARTSCKVHGTWQSTSGLLQTDKTFRSQKNQQTTLCSGTRNGKNLDTIELSVCVMYALKFILIFF